MLRSALFLFSLILGLNLFASETVSVPEVAEEESSKDRVEIQTNHDSPGDILGKLKETGSVSQKFVLTKDGRLVVSLTGKKKPKHKDLGSEVISAGYLQFSQDDGVSKLVLNNRSGGFCPSYESLALVSKFLAPVLTQGSEFSAFFLPNIKKCVVLESPEKALVKEEDLVALSKLPSNFKLFNLTADVEDAEVEGSVEDSESSDSESEEIRKLKVTLPGVLGKVKHYSDGKVKIRIQYTKELEIESIFFKNATVKITDAERILHTVYPWSFEGVFASYGEMNLLGDVSFKAHFYRSSGFMRKADFAKAWESCSGGIIEFFKAVNEFYDAHREVLNSVYKADHSFPLKALLDAGASPELLKLCNHPKLAEWVKDQKVSGQMTIGGRTFDFAVWTKIEQVFFYLSFVHTIGSL